MSNFNRYDATYNVPSGDTTVQDIKSVTAQSMEEAVKFITASQGSEPVNMALKEQNAIVVDITKEVSFTTSVTPAGAVSAGAIATPTSYSVVPGTLVIFEANATAGYDFVKWTKNGVDAGTELKVEIGITEDNTAIVAEYVAQ